MRTTARKAQNKNKKIFSEERQKIIRLKESDVSYEKEEEEEEEEEYQQLMEKKEYRLPLKEYALLYPLTIDNNGVNRLYKPQYKRNFDVDQVQVSNENIHFDLSKLIEPEFVDEIFYPHLKALLPPVSKGYTKNLSPELIRTFFNTACYFMRDKKILPKESIELMAQIMFEATWDKDKLTNFKLTNIDLLQDWVELWENMMQNYYWSSNYFIQKSNSWIPKAYDVLASLSNCLPMGPDIVDDQCYVYNMERFFIISAKHLVNDYEKKMRLFVRGTKRKNEIEEFKVKETLFWAMANTVTDGPHKYINISIDIILSVFAQIACFGYENRYAELLNILGKYMNMVLRIAKHACCIEAHEDQVLKLTKRNFPDMAIWTIANKCEYFSEMLYGFIDIRIGELFKSEAPYPKSITETTFVNYYCKMEVIPKKNGTVQNPFADGARLLIILILLLLKKVNPEGKKKANIQKGLKSFVSRMRSIGIDNEQFVKCNLDSICKMFDIGEAIETEQAVNSNALDNMQKGKRGRKRKATTEAKQDTNNEASDKMPKSRRARKRKVAIDTEKAVNSKASDNTQKGRRARKRRVPSNEAKTTNKGNTKASNKVQRPRKVRRHR
jgi:hypothetical protein